MRLGIDLGTTRTIVAAADRGNYPVVGFTTTDGDVVDFFPTVSAEVAGKLVHGHEAADAARRGAPYLRSWKRLVGRYGPEHEVSIGAVSLTLVDLATQFLIALRDALRDASNLPADVGARPAVVISVPANAHSSQRFTTLEAFGAAGFEVRAMINEPSAAAMEFAHRHRTSLNTKRDHVCVYDLGGGTFDAALVVLADGQHEVVDSHGVRELGGDDFDVVLMEMALEQIDVHPFEVPDEMRLLLDECRAAKESIGPNSRRVILDLDALGDLAPSEPIAVSVAAYYERLGPLVTRSIAALSEVMATDDEADADLKRAAARHGVAGVYVVGGGSGLPVVSRALRARFGRRVHRSAYPAASTAIGLAIGADAEEAPRLTERFTRHFGVFRERDDGREVAFDSIFPRGAPMPQSGQPPLSAVRRYRARHNIGHFRFIECAALNAKSDPAGDMSPHQTIRFSFDPQTRGIELDGIPIRRLPGVGPLIEERFEVDSAGVVAVTIRDVEAQFEKRFVL